MRKCWYCNKEDVYPHKCVFSIEDPKVVDVLDYMQWRRTVRNNPAYDLGVMMELLHELMLKEDVAYEFCSKKVRLYDHLDFDKKDDLFDIEQGPLHAMFLLVWQYVHYKKNGCGAKQF